MSVDQHRLGVAIAGVGLVLMLTLRFWASPIAMTITGRPHVETLTFLSIPLFLLVVGAGIVVFFWGDELGLAD